MFLTMIIDFNLFIDNIKTIIELNFKILYKNTSNIFRKKLIFISKFHKCMKPTLYYLHSIINTVNLNFFFKYPIK